MKTKSTQDGTGTHNQLDHALLQCLGLSPDSAKLVTDELNRLREQNRVLREALESSQIALNNPDSETWRKTALTDLRAALAATKEGK